MNLWRNRMMRDVIVCRKTGEKDECLEMDGEDLQ